MLNITNIENTLYEWISDVSGITTIFANQNAPRPDGQYVSINILQSTPIGVEETESVLLPDASVDREYSNVESLLVSINTYRSDAYQLATKLKDSLARVTVREKLFSSGLGYARASTVNDIPEVIDENWESRSQFDCFFFVRSNDSENIESIKQIGYTNELDGTTTVVKHPDIP